MKEITLSTGVKVKVFPLTYGYLMDAEDGVIKETKHGAIIDTTELTEDDIRGHRIDDVDALYKGVLQATYPDLYDDEGNLKPLPDEEASNKKKV